MEELSNKLKELEEARESSSRIEEWVQEFMEGVVENLEHLSVSNYFHLESIKKVLNNEALKSDAFLIEKTAYDSYKRILDISGEEAGMKSLKEKRVKLEKLQKFFDNFDI
jgi:hypothetical protein